MAQQNIVTMPVDSLGKDAVESSDSNKATAKTSTWAERWKKILDEVIDLIHDSGSDITDGPDYPQRPDPPLIWSSEDKEKYKSIVAKIAGIAEELEHETLIGLARELQALAPKPAAKRPRPAPRRDDSPAIQIVLNVNR